MSEEFENVFLLIRPQWKKDRREDVFRKFTGASERLNGKYVIQEVQFAFEVWSASQAREAELRERLETAEKASDSYRKLNDSNVEVLDSVHANYDKALTETLQRAEAAEALALVKTAIADNALSNLEAAEAALATLRDKKFAKFNNEDCWIFQDDGADELQSLVCPVVIKPARLIELLAAEARIKASQEQEPFVWVIDCEKDSDFDKLIDCSELGTPLPHDIPSAYLSCVEACEGVNIKLYLTPPIPPELAELQREIETLQSALDAKVTICGDEQIGALKRENAELRKLLESKVPEGWSISKLKTCYTLSHGNQVIATFAGPGSEKNAATIAAMLSAQPKEPKQ